ncbi:MAG: hypothetical protein N2423_07420, partial [Novosphingobium sp.]|nr:hypothetical protein [Novosphingobium sp.]
MSGIEYRAEIVDGLSISRGMPLAEEQGLGALTLSGYIREITARWGTREAAMITLDGVTTRWTYADLWDRSLEVAKALV